MLKARFQMYLLLSLLATAAAKNVFVSSPFDNFRIECPKRAAATEISVRMVESVGQKRQDIVFDMSCENVDQLYPWVNIPVGVSDIEREDCHYSEMLDPILDENTTFTCAQREYMAGITRLSDTRIQIMCCRLRSRDEFNCIETSFNKPIGLTRSTLIEHDNQLINAVRISSRSYVVRFCDLAPRAIPSIIADEKVRSTTAAPEGVQDNAEPQHEEHHEKHDPLKLEKVDKSEVPEVPEVVPTEKEPEPTKESFPKPAENLPPIRAESVRTENADLSSQSLAELPESVDEFVAPSQEPLPTLFTHEVSVVQTPPKPITQVDRSTDENVSAKVSEPQPSPLPEAPPKTAVLERSQLLSGRLVDEILKKISNAPSEQKAAQIFQQSVNELLQSANEQPLGVLSPTIATATAASRPSVTDGPPAATPPVASRAFDASKITFGNDAFPKPGREAHGRLGKTLTSRFSKESLPLRKDASEDLVGMQQVNFEGRRRSPIRTHRPHVVSLDEISD